MQKYADADFFLKKRENTTPFCYLSKRKILHQLVNADKAEYSILICHEALMEVS